MVRWFGEISVDVKEGIFENQRDDAGVTDIAGQWMVHPESVLATIESNSTKLSTGRCHNSRFGARYELQIQHFVHTQRKMMNDAVKASKLHRHLSLATAHCHTSRRHLTQLCQLCQS
jgi:hypothetical protein